MQLKAIVNGEITTAASSYVCPFPECRAYSSHWWAFLSYATDKKGSGRYIDSLHMVVSKCDACLEEVVFLGDNMVRPAVSEAPAAAADMPSEIKGDFEEARQLLPISPRGSAALLRLAVQKLLPLLGATPGDINKMIAELVQKGTISVPIQRALDSVRVIGNEAVHPGVMDLTDDVRTATSLFGLINFIIEKAITEPKEIAAIYAGLPPAKLAGIEQRDQGGS